MGDEDVSAGCDPMRKLLHVPVLHVSADLGSVAPFMDKKSAEICGKVRWEKHKQSVSKYWNGLECFFKQMDARDLKIYQDGLTADGEPGLRIIERGASRGSRNHEIVLDLVRRGARILKTEDEGLLKQEYEQLLGIVKEGSARERSTASVTNELSREELLEERDRFIAGTVNHTLVEGETGVVFIGAFHNVLPLLARDIKVDEIKQRDKVAAYFRHLIAGGDEKTFDELAAYLSQPPMTGE